MNGRLNAKLTEQAVKLALKRLKELELLGLLYKVSGIRWFIAGFEGFPLRYYHISMEKAEVLAALLEQLLRALNWKLACLEGFHVQIMSIESDDTKLLVFKEQEILYSLSVEKWVSASLEKVLDKVLKEQEFKCPWCGTNLIYETFECKFCKSAIPFSELVCPKCGTSYLVKKCPICENMVKHEEVALVKKFK